jgi:SanA protein
MSSLFQRRTILVLILVPLLFCLAILAVDRYMTFYSGPYCFDEISRLPDRRVGLLLGTSQHLSSGERNLFFDYRMDAAAKLFHRKKVEMILASGARHSRYYDETRAMVRALVERDVPPHRIMTDNEGFRTLESVIRARDIYGIRDPIVVSQKIHNERAVFLARHNDIQALAYNARSPGFLYGLKTWVRELFARVRAVVDLHIISLNGLTGGEN